MSDQHIKMHRQQQSFDTTEYENYRINQREQRLFVQKKTFTKWMNSFLVKASMHVDDIFVDLSDGKKLLKLLEIISGERLGKPASGQMRIHNLENVNKCLKFLIENEKMKIENISAEDIVDCNQKLTLGLVWSIILRFQIKDIDVNYSDDDDDEDQGEPIPEEQQPPKPKHSPKEALLLWCQKRTKRYEHVSVVDFGESWRDGMAFNALIHSHRPDLVDYNELDPSKHIENLNSAFELARDHLDIQPLLDAEDVDTDRPDEPSILTYVSSFYHTISPSDPAPPPVPKSKPPPQERSLPAEAEEAEEEKEPVEVEEEEIAPAVKSVEVQEAAQPVIPESPPEPSEEPKLEEPPQQQEGDNFWLLVIAIAVGFTILRSVFHDTANWFMNRSLDSQPE